MTRLLTCGWETNDINESGVSVTGAAATQTLVTTTPTPRSPSVYCLKMGSTSTVSNNASRTWTLASSKTEMWTRFAVIFHLWTIEGVVATIYDSGGGSAGIQGVVSWHPSDLLIRAYRGQNTLLGTSTLQCSADTWHTVEIRWQITSGTVGIIEVWVDGTRFLNLTGIDNTNTGNLNVQGFALGAANGVMLSGGYTGLDDIAVNDTVGTINNGQIGDGRIVLLKPNGAGSNTAFIRGGTDSGANWSQVDELPPSMTDYVTSATLGARDTYTLEDVPSGTWTVNACEVIALAQNADVGTGSLALTVKSGATTTEGTAQNLTTSAQYFRQLFETDPATSSLWTQAGVNALEAGATVR